MPDNLIKQSSEFKESLVGQAKDFCQSLVHTALESPCNGVIQLIDRSADLHLQPLDIVGEPARDSLGAKAGEITGSAILLALASLATKGRADLLGDDPNKVKTGMLLGGLYCGVFTPSSDDAKNIWADRLTAGLVGAATFGATAGTSKFLDSFGRYSVPLLRTLPAYIGVGAAAGAAGGLAGAETSSIFKDGKIVPAASELGESVLSSALFGGVYGALGFTSNRLAAQGQRSLTVSSRPGENILHNDWEGQPQALRADLPLFRAASSASNDTASAAHPTEADAKLTVRYNFRNEPVSVEAVLPSLGIKGISVDTWKAEKMSNGNWRGQLNSHYNDGYIRDWQIDASEEIVPNELYDRGGQIRVGANLVGYETTDGFSRELTKTYLLSIVGIPSAKESLLRLNMNKPNYYVGYSTFSSTGLTGPFYFHAASKQWIGSSLNNQGVTVFPEYHDIPASTRKLLSAYQGTPDW